MLKLTRRDFLRKGTLAVAGMILLSRANLFNDPPVQVTYDPVTNAIIIAGGSEKHPATTQHLYDAAALGLIPASVAGNDIVFDRGVRLQVGGRY